ncbi:2-succinyl-5-enolpyruvyl-6-hydroxy-3-cyclohexene-1-carboxylate synthase [Porphyridium purpureum]|uniref:isochorismate synthase n=1 Tax=Porphyridium purpureum TaxID=35688 RepID=A0A5J4YTP2_PORPP|nr:2-succinyl-5-enolpyruvyl-6-hydroxy-3-cyclohexene-1-carboxylate synthase [Porphyridium purpureum]|eukprot:POR4564..scf229_5
MGSAAAPWMHARAHTHQEAASPHARDVVEPPDAPAGSTRRPRATARSEMKDAASATPSREDEPCRRTEQDAARGGSSQQPQSASVPLARHKAKPRASCAGKYQDGAFADAAVVMLDAAGTQSAAPQEHSQQDVMMHAVRALREFMDKQLAECLAASMDCGNASGSAGADFGVDDGPSLREAPSEPRVVRVRVKLETELPALAWLRAFGGEQERIFFRDKECSFETAGIRFALRETAYGYSAAKHERLVCMLPLSEQGISQAKFYGCQRFDDSAASQASCEWADFGGYTYVLPLLEYQRIGKEDCSEPPLQGACEAFLTINLVLEGASDERERCASRKSTILQAISALASAELAMGSQTAKTQAALSGWPDAAAGLTSFRERVNDDYGAWETSIEAAKGGFALKKYQKIVLARRKTFEALGNQTDPVDILERLVHSCNVGYLFCLQLNSSSAFLGCSPERLFRLSNGCIATEAVAGTIKNSQEKKRQEEAERQLLSSLKDLEEHRIVVEYIQQALESILHDSTRSGCDEVVSVRGPELLRLPHLMHIRTSLEATVANDTESSQTHARVTFRLLDALHPTPAVCGLPKQLAQQDILRLERFDRGCYAGPFGYFGSNCADYCVAIRSGLVKADRVLIYGGAGIVPESVARSEWDEIELKLSTFARALETRALETRDPKQPLPFGVNQSGARALLPKASNSSNQPDERHDLANGNVAADSARAAATFVAAGGAASASGVPPPFGGTSAVPQLLLSENLNMLWGSCIVEELVRLGIEQFFVCPGSRSSPLAIGVMRCARARYLSCHDERGAAFMAVGFGRVAHGIRRKPAAVITSSGTAVANLLPACVEAFQDDIPLLLLTADRPPELRDVGANQAIDQVKLLGKHVRWFKDFPCPGPDSNKQGRCIENLLSDIDYAVSQACSRGRAGPVHLNFMFRETLAPEPEERKPPSADHEPFTSEPCEVSQLMIRRPNLLNWVWSSFPWCSYSQPCADAYNQGNAACMLDRELLELVWGAKAGLIIAGSLYNAEDMRAAVNLGRLLQWPVYPDVLSGLRLRKHPELVHLLDQMLLSDVVSEYAAQIDTVLVLGTRLVSKRVHKLILANARQVVVVNESVTRFDEHFNTSFKVQTSPHAFANALELATKGRRAADGGVCGRGHGDGSRPRAASSTESGSLVYRPASSLMELVSLGRHLEHKLSGLFQRSGDVLTEPLAARIVVEAYCARHPRAALFVSNSMPVRDVDMFAPAVLPDFSLMDVVGCNRGASGIDGVLSSAIGFCMAASKPVLLLIGDMAFLHDMNALHTLKQAGDKIAEVTIVLLNNGGGGIFSFLPIAAHPDVFTPLFDTPHQTKFEHLASMYDMQYELPRSADELKSALDRTPARGSSVRGSSTVRHKLIEVRTEQHANLEYHRHLGRTVQQWIEEHAQNERDKQSQAEH